MIKKLFVGVARKFYKKQYQQLHDRLINEYEKIEFDKTHSCETLSMVLISAEDHRFYYHIGFDPIGVLRALVKGALYKKVEGASTIEQQLVRVLTNEFDRTLRRKIQEVFLATTVSLIIPKKSIPWVYLQVAYYGAGIRGLDSALFAMNVSTHHKISIENAAEIVSMIKYPKNGSQQRSYQIQMRKTHLLALHKKHLLQRYWKVYGRN